MRRGRVFFYLAFVLILGLVGVLVVYTKVIVPNNIKQAAAKATPTQLPTNIFVLQIQVPQGYVFKVEDFPGADGKAEGKVLKLVPWAKDQITTGMYTEQQKNELIGRRTKYQLDAELPVLASMLQVQGEQLPMSGSAWAQQIPERMVAVSIPITQLTSVSYGLRPGDHVDVIVSMMFVDLDTDFQSILPNFTGLVIASGPADPITNLRNPLTVEIAAAQYGDKIIAGGLYGKVIIDPVLGQAVYIYPSELQRARAVSQRLIQNATVLQVGDFPLAAEEAAAQQPRPTATPGGEQPAGNTQQIPIPQTITLIVTPQDAIALNYLLLGNTHLSLAMRNPADTNRIDILPVTLQFLLEQYQIPIPVKLPYGTQPRMDPVATPTP